MGAAAGVGFLATAYDVVSSSVQWGNAGFLAKQLGSKAADCNTFNGGCQLRNWAFSKLKIHFHPDPRTHTPARHCRRPLMSDVLREEVSQKPEKNQPGNAVRSENPGATAFKVSAGRRLRKRLGS